MVDKNCNNFFLTPKAMRIYDKILTSGKNELIYNLIWLLTHLADFESSRDLLLNSCVFSKVLDILDSNNSLHVMVVRNAFWLISILSRGFEGEMKKLKAVCKKNTSITVWVSWYKKSAKIPTDITEDVIRNYALKNDLVDVKVCAVSEVWSGLKLVVPVSKR